MTATRRALGLAILAICCLAGGATAGAAELTWSGTIQVQEGFHQALGGNGCSSDSFSQGSLARSWTVDTASATTSETSPGVFEGTVLLHPVGSPAFDTSARQHCDEGGGACFDDATASSPGLLNAEDAGSIQLRYDAASHKLEMTPATGPGSTGVGVDALITRGRSCDPTSYSSTREYAFGAYALPRLEEQPAHDYRFTGVESGGQVVMRGTWSNAAPPDPNGAGWLGSPITTFTYTTLNTLGAYDFTSTGRLDVVGSFGPPPVFGEQVTVAPEKGVVLVRRAGASGFERLSAGEGIPVGSTVDATNGQVGLTSARDAKGATQKASFFDGEFTVKQPKGAHGRTDLVLPRASCGARTRAASMARRRRHALWGHGTGSFRTQGSYGTATVSGTYWYTENRCDGTLVRVKQGTVKVRDLVRRRTVSVHAGHSYLARRP